MTTAPCPMTMLVDRHFAARIRPQAERELRDHLPGCATCRTRYDRHLVFHRVDPRGRNSEARIAVGLGLEPPRRSAVVTLSLAAAGVAAIATMMLFVLRPSTEQGFSPRGPADTDFWVFHMEGNDASPVPDVIDPDTELAFAYKNGAKKRFLLIFGVDEGGRVYWYHPAWTSESESPTAVPIEPGGLHELPAAIRHRLVGHRLELHAVFLDEPLSVREAEVRLARSRDRSLALPDAIERTVWVEVRR
jgi:hypothetical protein